MASEDGYHTVLKVGDMAEGQGVPAEVDGRALALFLDGGSYYAIDDACPHQGAPLHDGIVSDGTVFCTWHGWCFRLNDGRWVDNPRVRVASYPVRVVGDEVQVKVD